MEAVERWSACYPEIEPLSHVLKNLHSSFRAFGEPRSNISCDAEARNVVNAETSEFRELAKSHGALAEQMRHSLDDVPLSSLTALHMELQSEMQRSPSSGSAIGGVALCDGLRDVLDSAGRGVPSVANDLFAVWVQEFVRQPLQEIHTRAQRVASLINSYVTQEHSMVERIRSVSEQICQPGYRSDRVELMDTRSVLAQHLLALLREKQREVDGKEPDMVSLLDVKLRSFEQAHSASLQTHRDEVAHHGAAAENLFRQTEMLARYKEQKGRSYHIETKTTEERGQQRAAKVLRVAEVLQQAFTGILETIEECRHDGARRCRVEHEQQHVAQVTEDLKKRFSSLQELHMAVARRSEEAIGVELKFANWIREAYAAMKDHVSQQAKSFCGCISFDKARMLALSRIAVEHVRVQRDQVQHALDHQSNDLIRCQEIVSTMEFSKPSSEDISRNLRMLEQVEQSVNWQQHEVDALAVVEQRISHGAAEIVGDSSRSHQEEGMTLEQWAGLVRKADSWVGEFFYTWQKEVSTQRAVSSPNVLELGSSPCRWGFGSLSRVMRRPQLTAAAVTEQEDPRDMRNGPEIEVLDVNALPGKSATRGKHCAGSLPSPDLALASSTSTSAASHPGLPIPPSPQGLSSAGNASVIAHVPSLNGQERTALRSARGLTTSHHGHKRTTTSSTSAAREEHAVVRSSSSPLIVLATPGADITNCSSGSGTGRGGTSSRFHREQKGLQASLRDYGGLVDDKPGKSGL